LTLIPYMNKDEIRISNFHFSIFWYNPFKLLYYNVNLHYP